MNQIKRQSAEIERVFLSSTYEDLKRYRQAAATAIRRFGWLTVAMEDFLSCDKRPKNVCLDRVRNSDLYIGIFAHRYGYVPGSDKYSITEQEYRCARRKGIDCLIFIVDESQPWIKACIDGGSGAKALVRLKEKLKKHHVVSFFTTEDDLAAKVSACLAIRTREKLVDQLLELSARTSEPAEDSVPAIGVQVFTYDRVPQDVRCQIINKSDYPTRVKTILSASVGGKELKTPVPGHYAADETWDLPALNGFEGHFDLAYLLRPVGVTYELAKTKQLELRISVDYSATTQSGKWRTIGRLAYHFDYDREQWIVDP